MGVIWKLCSYIGIREEKTETTIVIGYTLGVTLG